VALFSGPISDPWQSTAHYSTFKDFTEIDSYLRPADGYATWNENPYISGFPWYGSPVDISLRNLTLQRVDSKGSYHGEEWPDTVVIIEARFIRSQ
jgi:hypothetical protein